MSEILAQFGIFLAAMGALALWSIRRTKHDRKTDQETHDESRIVRAG